VSQTGPKGTIMQPRILRRSEIETVIGLSRSSIYNMMAEGTFPKPMRLGRRAVGWLESDVTDWLSNCQRVGSEQ
jgi:prophage regulatory protein